MAIDTDKNLVNLTGEYAEDGNKVPAQSSIVMDKS